jgi:DNA-binding transcriptional ArsR family regulator
VKPITNIDDPRYVKAMSHPLRVRILAMLQERTACPVELADWLGARLGTVAYHVRTLHRLGLVELVDETRVRGATAHHYRAVERPVISNEAWAAAPAIAKQAAVSSTLQTIDEYARAAAAAGGFDPADCHLTRLVMRLDPQGRRELTAAAMELLGEAQRIEAEARERLEREPHIEGTTDLAMVTMLFEALRLTDVPGPGRAAPRAVTA